MFSSCSFRCHGATLNVLGIMPYLNKAISWIHEDITKQISIDGEIYQQKYEVESLTSKDESVMRSGTNSPVKLKTLSSQKGGKGWELVPEKVLTHRILVRTSKSGRAYWKRMYMVQWRYRKVGPRLTRNLMSGSDLPPNRLHYSKISVAPFGVRHITTTKLFATPQVIAYSHSGPLWQSFAPYGSGYQITPAPYIYYASPYSNEAGLLITELDEICRTKLHSRVLNQSVSLGQALAEYKQTSKMFADAFQRLVRALIALKKLKLRRAANILFPQDSKELANDFLLWRYGISPLLSDIDGMAKELATPVSTEFDVIVARKRKIPITTIHESEFEYNSICGKTKITIDGEVTVKYKVRLRVNANSSYDLSRLGISNLNAIAWEVIPWSFILDWIIPIGDYLANREAFTGLTILHAHKTVFIKEDTVFLRQFGGTHSGGQYRTDSGDSGLVISKVFCNRTLVTGITLPTPKIENPFSLGHIANLAALLRQLY